MMVATSALGEHRQFTGRLMKELRVKRGLNYGDYAYLEYFEQAGGSTLPAPNVPRRQQAFTVWLRPVATENQLFATRAAVYELQQYRSGITRDEFDTVKGFLSGYTLLWEQTPMRRLGYAMDDVFYGTKDFLGGFRKALASMTVDDVNRVIPKWIDPGVLKFATVTSKPAELKQAIVTNAPSPIRYVAEAPEADVTATDQKIVDLPLDIDAQQLEVRPASALFER
jgi:zinc protease